MGLRTFTFAGTSSSAYSMFITEAATYNVPERAVEMLEIPGRSGHYALDQGRFENVEVTYHVVVHKDTNSNFQGELSDVRNWLASKVGYQRLTDDYNTGVYRMAIFKGGLDIGDAYINGAEFDIVFECKPQRWLTSGETPIEIGAWGDTQTVSGDIVQFNALETDKVKSLVADIDPIQDLHGYDKPWVGGGGVNLFEPFSGTSRGIDFTPQSDGTVTISGTVSSSGWISTYKEYPITDFGLSVGDPVFIHSNGKTSDDGHFMTMVRFYDSSSTQLRQISGEGTTTVPNNAAKVRLYYYGFGSSTPQQGTVVNDVGYFEFGKGSTLPTSWTPYENICPISGWASVDVVDCGINLWDEEWENAVIDGTNGSKTPGGSRVATKNYVRIAPSTEYYFYCPNVSTSNHIAYYDKDKRFISGSNALNSNSTITTPSGAKYLMFSLSSSYGSTYNDDISLNCPSTDHSYHTYNGTTYTTSLGTTVYGGYVDIVGGELGVYPYYASYNGEALTGEWISDRDKYESGTTPTTGAQVVDMGGAATTSTITGQTVDTLLGTNNIFADSGNVTVEYGQDPMVLINPTPFDASPLLAVKGYGNIDMGGQDIDIQSVPLGEIVIYGNEADYTALTRTVTLDVSRLNSADTIAASCVFDTRIKTQHSRYFTSFALGTETDCSSSWVKLGTTQYDFYITPTNLGFVKGTSATKTCSIAFNVGINGTNYSKTITCSVAYDGDDTLTLSASIDSTTPGINFYKYAKMQETTADSTMSALGNPMYIDLDIGEAWNEDSGEPVSVNNAVTLPSDLPKLPSGATTFTYDGTITELKVTPRWWKV